MKNKLTYSEAHRLFRYDADTGKLYWRVSPAQNVKAGDEAGTVRREGRRRYRYVQPGGKNYLTHRIVWLMHYGSWPKREIDHIDGDGMNNRIDNLRDVPKITNMRNSRMRSDNTSGVNGVTWDKRNGKWKAQSKNGSGRNKHLGYHTDIAAAEKAVLDYQTSLGFTDRHGKGGE